MNGVSVNAPLNYANAGATSLFTTAPDLVKWLDNFRDSKVGGAAAIARLQEQTVVDGASTAFCTAERATDRWRAYARMLSFGIRLPPVHQSHPFWHMVARRIIEVNRSRVPLEGRRKSS
jgi:hypothetical protein